MGGFRKSYRLKRERWVLEIDNSCKAIFTNLVNKVKGIVNIVDKVKDILDILDILSILGLIGHTSTY